MESKLSFTQDIGARVHRALQALKGNPCDLQHAIAFNNPFSAMHMRKINGVYKPIGVYNGRNAVTIEGKNHLLDVVFGNSTPVTQIDPWYIGLINQTPTPTLSENDTLALHAAWNEFTTYSGNRVAWADANASAKVKGSSSTSDFTITTGGTVHGIMIASVATGTSGILWATGAFDASIVVVASDVLKITYGIRT